MEWPKKFLVNVNRASFLQIDNNVVLWVFEMFYVNQIIFITPLLHFISRELSLTRQNYPSISSILKMTKSCISTLSLYVPEQDGNIQR